MEGYGSFGVMVFWGSGEILAVLRHRRGGAYGCRHSFLKGVGCTPSPLTPAYGGNPRPWPGSSVVIVAVLLEGGAWYATIRNSRSVVELVRRAQRWRATLVLLIYRCRHCFLFFFSCFLFWAWMCCGPSSCSVVSVGCYIYIAGRKPISREKCASMLATLGVKLKTTEYRLKHRT